ncbi:hypothetical protein [Paenibacillus sp. y28]
MNPNIQIESIYAAGYLNLISQTMKEMKIPQTIDEKVRKRQTNPTCS